MHFSIRASDVSALCGRNCYRDRASAIKTLVDANVPPSMEPPPYRDVLTELEELVRSGPVYTEAIASRDLAPQLSAQAESESLTVFQRYVSQFPQSERRRIRTHVRTMYLKDRGLVMEVDTLRRLEDETGVSWFPTERKRRFFTRTFLVQQRRNSEESISYTINGSVDGFERRGEEVCGILEVKNRRDRIFHHQHDIDQVVLYLILSGLDTGRLVQSAGGRINASLIVTQSEASERWNHCIRPQLERALEEAAVRVRRSAVEASARWRPFCMSHVLVNPPPQSRRVWKTDNSTQTDSSLS